MNKGELQLKTLIITEKPSVAQAIESEAVKCGRFTGSRQTLAYVNDVIGRYDKYCRIARR